MMLYSKEPNKHSDIRLKHNELINHIIYVEKHIILTFIIIIIIICVDRIDDNQHSFIQCSAIWLTL